MKRPTLNFDKVRLQDLLRQGQRWLFDLPRWLFIRHSHLLDVLAVIGVLLVAVYLLLALLYREPPGVMVVEPEEQQLSTGIIDRLELWIEERDIEKQRSLEIPTVEIFEELSS